MTLGGLTDTHIGKDIHAGELPIVDGSRAELLVLLLSISWLLWSSLLVNRLLNGRVVLMRLLRYNSLLTLMGLLRRLVLIRLVRRLMLIGLLGGDLLIRLLRGLRLENLLWLLDRLIWMSEDRLLLHGC